MTFIGIIVGQFGFGFLADVMGRKLASICTACLTIGGTVASACVNNNGPVSIVMCLAICRFFAGLGIGGEYPLSAALSQEMGHNFCLNRTTLLQINICMLNLGSISQAILCLILVS